MSVQPDTESETKRHKIVVAVFVVTALFAFAGLCGWIAYSYSIHRGQVGDRIDAATISDLSSLPSNAPQLTPSDSISVTAAARPAHIKTPPIVRGIYVTSWVASIPTWRERLASLILSTELNAVVIDVKDYSGYISIPTDDPLLKGSVQIRSKDLPEWIDSLHKRGIYVIARVTVFQDPLYAKSHPSQAVQTRDGQVWVDRNGLAFVDASAQPFWDYIVHIAVAAEKIGFDEINFDYIRFPTDGNLANMSFPLSGPAVLNADRRFGPPKVPSGSVNLVGTSNMSPRERVLDRFFGYLADHTQSLGVPISADTFGMTTSNYDDLGIGQVLETVARHFDYVCPMVYPSHYPHSFDGYANPADHPYEIIRFAMTRGVSRLQANGIAKEKLRPWIQDFNLGARYDAEKIIAEKRAIYDSGLTSFLVWDPANKYTAGAYSVSTNETSGQ